MVTKIHEWLKKVVGFFTAGYAVLTPAFLLAFLVSAQALMPAIIGYVEFNGHMGPYAAAINNVLTVAFTAISYALLALFILYLVLVFSAVTGHEWNGLLRLRNAMAMFFALQWLAFMAGAIFAFAQESSGIPILVGVILLAGIFLLTAALDELVFAVASLQELADHIVKILRKHGIRTGGN